MSRLSRSPFLCLVIATCAAQTVSGQVIESVTFDGVTPDVVGTGDFRTYQIETGGDVRSIDYSGTITSIDPATYASEVTFDIFGSGASVVSQLLSRITNFDGSTDFSGNIPLDVVTTIGDLWSFSFFETFDDGDDGLADANLDITFSFRDTAPPPPTVSDLGIFNLTAGEYGRGGSTDPFPYTVVPFEVSESGSYVLEADWIDSTTNASFDGYLYLLDSPFAGTDAASIASNDDDLTTASSRLETQLDSGTVYYALLTTYSSRTDGSNLQGLLSTSSSFGGTAVAIPEPGTALALTLGALLLATRRRQR